MPIKAYIFSAIVFVAIGAFFTIYLTNRSNERSQSLANTTVMNLSMPEVDRLLQRIRLNAILIEDVRSKRELVTMETELRQEITFDDSLRPFDFFANESSTSSYLSFLETLNNILFRRMQNITLYGVGKYSTDLSGLTEEDIIFDFDNNLLTIRLNSPTVSSLEILNERTTVYNPDRGLLMLFDTELTFSEHNVFYGQVKNNMYLELNSDYLMEQAYENTVEAVTDIFNTILVSADMHDLSVNIEFKG